MTEGYDANREFDRPIDKIVYIVDSISAKVNSIPNIENSEKFAIYEMCADIKVNIERAMSDEEDERWLPKNTFDESIEDTEMSKRVSDVVATIHAEDDDYVPDIVDLQANLLPGCSITFKRDFPPRS